MQALDDQGEEIEAAQASAVASAAASEGLHASLESQLRASNADVGRLQSEVARLKAAAASKAAASNSALSDAHDRLAKDLKASQAEVKQLQAQIEQAKAEDSAFSAASASVAADSPVSRDGNQTASVSSRSVATAAGSHQGWAHTAKQLGLTCHMNICSTWAASCGPCCSAN